MTYSELKRKLKKAGCKKLSRYGRHEIWHSPITDIDFPVARHPSKEVPIGTLKSIIEAAGIII